MADPTDHSGFTIAINDEWIDSSNLSVEIRRGVTYLPVRFFSNILQADVQWKAKERLVEIKKGKKLLIIDPDNKQFYHNGIKEDIEVIWKNNQVYTSSRVIAEALDYDVSYIKEGPIVRIKNSTSKLSDQEFLRKYQEMTGQQNDDSFSRNATKEINLVQTSTNKYSKIAYLTFDDGPNKSTSKILEILNHYEAKATFFMLAGNVQHEQDVVNRMIEDGHSLGSHGVTHSKEKFYHSINSILNELNSSRGTIKKVTEIDSFLMRVPYGSYPHMTPSYRAAVSDAGYVMWDWNVDSEDWKYPNNSTKIIELTISQIKKLEEQEKAPVILFHDKEQTIQSLPTVIEYLQEHGYVLKAITTQDQPVQFRQ